MLAWYGSEYSISPVEVKMCYNNSNFCCENINNSTFNCSQDDKGSNTVSHFFLISELFTFKIQSFFTLICRLKIIST